MNVRRTALPLLAALLAGGCVALPGPHPAPAPRSPSTAPPALAPAAQRPPSALPAAPEPPVQAEPREELAEAEGEGRGREGAPPARSRADRLPAAGPAGPG
ncbi:hypothetical protein ACFCZV_01165, partial [Streptomyces hydrogenans]